MVKMRVINKITRVKLASLVPLAHHKFSLANLTDTVCVLYIYILLLISKNVLEYICT
jgi:hypothetical protein